MNNNIFINITFFTIKIKIKRLWFSISKATNKYILFKIIGTVIFVKCNKIYYYNVKTIFQYFFYFLCHTLSHIFFELTALVGYFVTAA